MPATESCKGEWLRAIATPVVRVPQRVVCFVLSRKVQNKKCFLQCEALCTHFFFLSIGPRVDRPLKKRSNNTLILHIYFQYQYTHLCTIAMSLQVFSVDRKTLYEFPENRVQHILQSTLDALVLCPRFAENGRCSRRNACRRVHAFAKDAVSCSHPHVNFIYTMVGDCMYECHSQESLSRIVSDDESTKSDKASAAKANVNGKCPPPPGHIRVLLPNQTRMCFVPIDRIIKTRVHLFGRRTPSVCAHYFYNRYCSLGAACNFVHFVYVDPAVATNRCAFAPANCELVPTGRMDPNTPASDDKAQQTSNAQVVTNVALTHSQPLVPQAVLIPIEPLVPLFDTVVPVVETTTPMVLL